MRVLQCVCVTVCVAVRVAVCVIDSDLYSDDLFGPHLFGNGL